MCEKSKTSPAVLRRCTPHEVITLPVIEAELTQPAVTQEMDTGAPDNLSAAVERNLARYFAGFADGLPPPGLYHRILREVEHPLLTAALTATRGNQIRAADLLGRQPQHAPQEDPGSRYPGHPHNDLTPQQFPRRLPRNCRNFATMLYKYINECGQPTDRERSLFERSGYRFA